MVEKVTIMKLKVDLQCGKCYTKVKKLLCKFPQIRDQMYDEKQNIVTITVVCCSPEKIRDKLCCKGEGCIKSIEIVEPPKKKPPPEKTCEPEKTTKDKPKDKPPGPKPESHPPTPKPPQPAVPIRTCCGPCSEGRSGGPCYEGCRGPRQQPCYCDGCCRRPESPPPKPLVLVCPPVVVPPAVVPIGTCCLPCREGPRCYCNGHCGRPKPTESPVSECGIPIGTCCESCREGRPGGPCFELYGGPLPSPYSCDSYYGRPICDSYGGSRPCYGSPCDQYFCEENASGCTIM